MMTATYSPDDNKLRLYSVTRLDRETYDRVKAAGFKWAAVQGLFVAPMWTPQREDLLIDLCGEITDEDTSLADRAEERADRFEGYKANRFREAEQVRTSVAKIADGIPMGQPILVGHHSERHARKDAERIENGMRKAVKLWKTSKYWEARAAGAIRHAKYKELPAVRARRIKVLEADKRRCERNRQHSRNMIGLWGQLRNPYKDGRPCDQELQHKRAHQILNIGHQYELYTRFEKGEISPREAQLICLRASARNIQINNRWIDHIDSRLTYERAMVQDAGRADLLEKKPRPKQLPLCNYRAPEGIDAENIYDHGRTIHYPQVEMLQAEWNQIPNDYKGTRVVDHSHRIRTAMRQHALYCVFITDTKEHTRPAAKEPPAPRVRAPRAPQPTPEPDPVAKSYDDIAAALRAGVTVVSAPNLFVTPDHVAERLVDLVDLQPADRVLEPSAGTGQLLIPVVKRLRGPYGALMAVERVAALANRIAAAMPNVEVRTADFLELTATEIGHFDKIVMNPPFDHGSDVKHIMHARSLLTPGGRLAAVCANGPRQREALESIAREWINLPAGTFKDAGTNVNTAIVVLEAE